MTEDQADRELRVTRGVAEITREEVEARHRVVLSGARADLFRSGWTKLYRLARRPAP